MVGGNRRSVLNQFSRTQLLLGSEGINKLQGSTVAVFGVGGVGSFTVDALVRSGIGHIVIVDDDDICLTNLNRQLIANRNTVGKSKVEVAKEMALAINPKIKVTTHQTFFGLETVGEFDFSSYDYVVDAIDTVSAKLLLVEKCNETNTKIISCMGAGNKLDPTRFEVADIYKTSVCPLARVMRTELRKRGIKKLKVVYSKEPAMTPIDNDKNSCKHNCICPPTTKRNCNIRRQIPGSVAFVPSVAGLIIAGEVLKGLAL